MIGLIISFFAGGFVGVFVMAACALAGRADSYKD